MKKTKLFSALLVALMFMSISMAHGKETLSWTIAPGQSEFQAINVPANHTIFFNITSNLNITAIVYSEAEYEKFDAGQEAEPLIWNATRTNTNFGSFKYFEEEATIYLVVLNPNPSEDAIVSAEYSFEEGQQIDGYALPLFALFMAIPTIYLLKKRQK